MTMYEFRTSAARASARTSADAADPVAADAFPELTRIPMGPRALYIGDVTDDAHLHGLLLRFRRAGLRIEQMRPLPTPPASPA